jgi:Uncharacterized protein conserved in bacteria
MKKDLPASLSKMSILAIKNLGAMIRGCRLERGITQQNLADRINVSRYTIIAIEKGDPKVAVGVVFEAAYIVGIPLLVDGRDEMKNLSLNLSNLAAILPKRSTLGRKNDNED